METLTLIEIRHFGWRNQPEPEREINSLALENDPSSVVADQMNQLVGAQRSGPRSRLHGTADGAVQPAPHQPRQPAPVQASQRPLRSS